MTKNERIRCLEDELTKMRYDIAELHSKINTVQYNHMNYFKHTKNTKAWNEIIEHEVATKERHLFVPHKEMK